MTVGFGGMSSAMALKMGGGKKKLPFIDDTSGTTGGDTGDDSVDPDGAEEDGAIGSSKGVNSSPEEEGAIGTGDDSDLPDEGEGPEMGTYDAVEDDAASELAGIVGVPEDKREAFKSALADYVAACVKKQGK